MSIVARPVHTSPLEIIASCHRATSYAPPSRCHQADVGDFFFIQHHLPADRAEIDPIRVHETRHLVFGDLAAVWSDATSCRFGLAYQIELAHALLEAALTRFVSFPAVGIWPARWSVCAAFFCFGFSVGVRAARAVRRSTTSYRVGSSDRPINRLVVCHCLACVACARSTSTSTSSIPRGIDHPP